MRVSSDDPLRTWTSGRQTTLRSSSAATLISGRTPCSAIGSKFMDSKIAAGMQSPLDHGSRNPQILGGKLLAVPIARHGDLEFSAFAEQQNSALAAGHR